ncbi:hypothetical protein VPH35_103540 [Triticum aestivum]
MAANHLHPLVSLDFSCAQTGITSRSSLEAATGASWASPSGRFSFGFYATEGGLAVGVWLATAPNVTITWTANRNDTGTGNTLRLADDGRLLWTGAGDHDRTIAQPSRLAMTGAVRDNGNFVLFVTDGAVVWQTFESPTTPWSPGRSSCPRRSSSPASSSYWNTRTFNLGFTLLLRLDTNGLLYQVNNNGSFTKNLAMTQPRALKAGEQAYYRLTLDPDGVLRLHRHTFVSGSGSASNTTTVVWSALTDRWDVHGVCGHNSYCVLDQDRPSCLCLLEICLRGNNKLVIIIFPSGDCKWGQQQDAADFSVKLMPNMEWADIPYKVVGNATSKAECMAACMADCLCVAVLRDAAKGMCSKHQLPLWYGRAAGRYTLFRHPSKPVGRTTVSVLVCIGILASIALSASIPSGLLLHVKRRAMLRNVAPANADTDGGEGLEEDEEATAPLRPYSYEELERATYYFRDPVGRGAFGTVFKGALRNGEQTIVVKRLEKLVEDGEREFQRELRAIGQTSHRNLVRLLAFCHEGANHLLVYDDPQV